MVNINIIFQFLQYFIRLFFKKSHFSGSTYPFATNFTGAFVATISNKCPVQNIKAWALIRGVWAYSRAGSLFEGLTLIWGKHLCANSMSMVCSSLWVALIQWERLIEALWYFSLSGVTLTRKKLNAMFTPKVYKGQVHTVQKRFKGDLVG